MYMASVEELDQQIDSGMGSSDVRSPEVKSLLPDDEDDEEEVRTIVILLKKNMFLYRIIIHQSSVHTNTICMYLKMDALKDSIFVITCNLFC